MIHLLVIMVEKTPQVPQKMKRGLDVLYHQQTLPPNDMHAPPI